MTSEKLIVVLGPTASGKTELGIRLAKKYDGEIICADSRTIYNDMDIGTAKPSKQQQAEVPHHLLDVVKPNESFSVVKFKTLCLKSIRQIRQKGKLPIIVGGSGLYIDSVLYDYGFRIKNGPDTSKLSDAEIVKLAKATYGEELMGVDSKNTRRVAQLLERGPSIAADRKAVKIASKIIGLQLEKPQLKQNIEMRTVQMLNNGFIQEVENVRSKYGTDCAALTTTGYKQVGEFLDGQLSESGLEAAIVRATLKLSKKQLTWFRRNKQIAWVHSFDQAMDIADAYMAQGLVQ